MRRKVFSAALRRRSVRRTTKMYEYRRKTRKVKVGNIYIGGDADIAIQSMTFTKTSDREATLAQIKSLEAAGCDIVRFAVSSEEEAKNIGYFKAHTSAALVADIQFSYKLALACVENGIDKIRLNPGNIGGEDRVKAVADACRKKGIPIRIGVNSGSVEKELLAKYGSPCPEALAESAVNAAAMLERHDFGDIVVSIKSSNVRDTILANRIFAAKTDYPLHLGLTEAGTERMGIIKSSAALGSLLSDGIGDTIRISLTADVEREAAAAKDLLTALGLRSGVQVVSCPTCSRTCIDLIGIADELGKRLSGCNKNITVAVMGCAVNGPGEAREADIGIAGGRGEGLLFKKGEIVKCIPESEIIDTVIGEIEKM